MWSGKQRLWWWTAGLLVALSCSGKTVVDDVDGGSGGSGGSASSSTGSSASSGTTSPTSSSGTPPCPSWLVTDNDPCALPGQVCPGEGADPYCWDWTCTCGSDFMFHCDPGVCQ